MNTDQAVKERAAKRKRRHKEARAHLARLKKARHREGRKLLTARARLRAIDGLLVAAEANVKRTMPKPVRPINTLPWLPPPRLTDSTR